MNKLFRLMLKENFAKWSLVVLLGSLFASFLNYIFALFMGRMLGPSSFGEVSTIFGLMVILVAPTQALSNFVSRHVSFLAGRKQYSEIKYWLATISHRAIFLSISLMIIFWFFIPLLSGFLGIASSPFVIFSFVFPLSFLMAIYTGALQGLKSFNTFSYQNILGAGLKLGLAILFVWLGLFVPGVMLALVVSLAISCLYNHIKIKAFWTNLYQSRNAEIFSDNQGENVLDIKHARFYKSFFIVLLAALILALVSNIDVILAKHYLNSNMAGEYAALSALGKILIYITSAFVTVMFSVVSESLTGESLHSKTTFRNTLLYISAVSLPVILVFGFIPNVIVGAFFGVTYLKIASSLPIFSLAMFLFSLTIAFIHYFLAIRNHSFIILFGIGALFQIYLIYINHSTIQNIVMSVLWSSIFLLLTMIMYYLFLQGRIILAKKYA